MRKLIGPARSLKLASAIAMILAAVAPSIPVSAQDSSQDARMRNMEAEIRALQRKVFPGGNGKYFPPEISAAAPSATPPPPSTSAVTDILTRMQSLEAQVAQLTGQVEQNSNRLSKLEARAIAGAAANSPSGAPSDPPPASPSASASQSNLDAMTGGASSNVHSASAQKGASGPSAARLAAVRAIVKPQTDDHGDDEYSYGFRLWDAKFYPEAEQQLQMFIDKYPKHDRISWARNLLGRAYLDDGNPGEAAKWFLQNYQADKRGDRAPDSLLYLAVSMKQLKDDKRACIALAEFSETYPAEATGRLKGLYDSTRNGLSCTAA
jgi:TolA-binding protein